MTDAPILDVEQVGIRFGGLAALKDVTFSVTLGEVLGLIGPNGAGKSTVLNCVTGIYRPTDGSVRVQGQDTVGSKPHLMRRRRVARTFQETLLIDDLSLVENILLGRTALRRSDLLVGLLNLPGAGRRYRRERAEALAVLGEFGLAQWADVASRLLPYGVRKLGEVARARFSDPALMLLDEPAAGLGPVDADRLSERITAIAATGVGVVLIDHNMDFVTKTADRVVVLSAGTVLAEGTPEAVRTDPAVIEAYLGKRASNHA